MLLFLTFNRLKPCIKFIIEILGMMIRKSPLFSTNWTSWWFEMMQFSLMSLFTSVKSWFWHFKTGTEFVRRQSLTSVTNFTYKKSSWLLSVLGATLGDLWVKCLSKYWIFLEWSGSVSNGKSFVLENLLFLHMKWKLDTGNDYWILSIPVFYWTSLTIKFFFVSRSSLFWPQFNSIMNLVKFS